MSEIPDKLGMAAVLYALGVALGYIGLIKANGIVRGVTLALLGMAIGVFGVLLAIPGALPF